MRQSLVDVLALVVEAPQFRPVLLTGRVGVTKPAMVDAHSFDASVGPKRGDGPRRGARLRVDDFSPRGRPTSAHLCRAGGLHARATAERRDARTERDDQAIRVVTRRAIP